LLDLLLDLLELLVLLSACCEAEQDCRSRYSSSDQAHETDPSFYEFR